MQKITIKSNKQKEIIDITKIVNDLLSKNYFETGLVHLFLTHTSCALATADLDPGTDEDYLDAIEAIFPKLKYRHPHNPEHVGDHIMSSIFGSSIIIPVQSSTMILGHYQKLVIIELSGPRDRRINVSFIPEISRT